MCNSFWGHPAWREQQSLSASACLAARPSVCCIGAQESPQLDPCSEAPALLCRQNPCEQLLFAFLTWQDSRSQPIPSTASGYVPPHREPSFKELMDNALAEAMAVSPKKKPAAKVQKKPAAKVVGNPEGQQNPENTAKTLEEQAGFSVLF